MRRAARIDANHKDVVDAFRACGCTAHSTAAIAGGFPDIIVARGGRTWLVEVKSDQQPPSRRKLRPLQDLFAQFWQGRVYVIESVDQVPSCIKDATR